LIQHGAADTFVAPDQSRKLYDALQTQHVPSELVIYPDAGRDFSKDGTPDVTVHVKAIADLEDFIAKTFPPAKPGANSPNGPTQPANSARPRAARPAAKSSSRK
jgi:fermentation-respiration switch protein FrsA (DUF1100 family)